MVINEELVSKVKSIFGLNTYEARIWLALLAKGTASASELADLADIPRSRAYDILESLEKKGFAIMKLGKPIRYMAVPPSDVINRIKKRYEEIYNNRLKSIESLKNSDLLKELEDVFKKGIVSLDISERSGTLKGYQNIISHIESMLKEAEKTVTILTTEMFFVRQVMTLKPVFMDLYNRGIKVRIIVPIVEENAKFVKDILEYAEIYDAGDMRGRIITVDGEEVMIMLFDEKEVHTVADIGVWLYAPALARSIDQVLEKILPSLKPASEVLKSLGL
ncbi:TrmB family transcriptional regulator [Nanoarchaeota archaeon NZ13-N]|nr:MAG: TrmB family transcriptional regulator [Nanoarchaeota archaeon NZ13-N]